MTINDSDVKIWENQGNNEIQWWTIDALKEDTKTWVLNAFYRDYWVFWNVFDILTWKKSDPSKLIADLENIRSTYKEIQAANDEKNDSLETVNDKN